MNQTYDMFQACMKSSTSSPTTAVAEQTLIDRAVTILESRLVRGDTFCSPQDVKRFCQLQIAAERDEKFGCLFLDTKHRLISFEILFHGTVDGASVYPRVVVRRGLELNASAVIFTHNHPSGVSDPSRADISITKVLKDTLALVDVRVLDHVVVGLSETTSMAERGLI